MGPGEPAIGQQRDSWIALLIRYLASHRDQCDPSLYLFIRWLTILLSRAILSQMTTTEVSVAFRSFRALQRTLRPPRVIPTSRCDVSQ